MVLLSGWVSADCRPELMGFWDRGAADTRQEAVSSGIGCIGSSRVSVLVGEVPGEDEFGDHDWVGWAFEFLHGVRGLGD